jgi:hypothetical protein
MTPEQRARFDLEVRFAFDARNALPPTARALFDQVPEAGWPRGGPCAVTIHRLDKVLAELEREEHADPGEMEECLHWLERARTLRALHARRDR